MKIGINLTVHLPCLVFYRSSYRRERDISLAARAVDDLSVTVLSRTWNCALLTRVNKPNTASAYVILLIATASMGARRHGQGNVVKCFVH